MGIVLMLMGYKDKTRARGGQPRTDYLWLAIEDLSEASLKECNVLTEATGRS